MVVTLYVRFIICFTYFYGFFEMGCDDGRSFKVGIQTGFTGGPLRQPLVACICSTCQLPANTVADFLVIA